MQTNPTSTTKEVIEAWGLYCDGNYESVVKKFHSTNSPDLLNLVDLASFELKTKSITRNSQKGMFLKLRNAMQAFHKGDHKTSSRLLCDWLLNKDYFSQSIMIRFQESAIKSESYLLILQVCKKYFSKKTHKTHLAEPFFLSLFHTEKHSEAIKLFESHREYFNSLQVLHKAALSYISQQKYEEAESLLLPLYEELNGKPYRNNFEEVKALYSDLQRIKELETIKKRNKSQNMEYGLTLLFTGKYKQALKIFQDVKI